MGCHHDRMRLGSADGAIVSLRPLGYQFPERSESTVDGFDWDANWLIVAAEIRTADGREWSFTSPCLTTAEADALGDWLDALSANRTTIGELANLEPVLSFQPDDHTDDHAHDRSDGQCRFRLRLALEALPPWSRDRFGSLDVPLTLSPADLTAAAQSWRADCAAFPAR